MSEKDSIRQLGFEEGKREGLRVAFEIVAKASTRDGLNAWLVGPQKVLLELAKAKAQG